MAITDPDTDDVHYEFKDLELALHRDFERMGGDFFKSLDKLIGSYDRLVSELRQENAALKAELKRS